MNTASPPVLPMYRALVGVGMLSGLLIALVYTTTRPIIERNRAEALERAIFDVLPAAQRRRTYVLTAAGELVPDAAGEQAGDRVHAGFDAAGRLVGVAIEASGMGYADTISILYGYAPAREAIVGMQVLASKETPGLGDRIETEPAFLANFEALDVHLNPAGTGLANTITTVGAGEKTEPWQIDGISGATVSSKAIGEILAASTARWVPLIHARRDALTPAGDDHTSPANHAGGGGVERSGP